MNGLWFVERSCSHLKIHLAVCIFISTHNDTYSDTHTHTHTRIHSEHLECDYVLLELLTFYLAFDFALSGVMLIAKCVNITFFGCHTHLGHIAASPYAK